MSHRGHVGRSWGHVGPAWAYVGPSWTHLGPMLGHLGAMLGLSWAILGLILGHLGAMLGQGGTPQSFFSRFMLFWSKSKKHRKLRGFSGADHWSAVGARSRIAKASGLRPGRRPRTKKEVTTIGREPTWDGQWFLGRDAG